MTDGKKKMAPAVAAYLVRTLIRWMLYVAAVFILIRCARAAYTFGYNVFDEHGMVSEENGVDVSVIVRETQSVRPVLCPRKARHTGAAFVGHFRQTAAGKVGHGRKACKVIPRPGCGGCAGTGTGERFPV